MGKPYSLDLRERICAYIAEGNSARSAGRLFGVNAATAVRLTAEHREHGTAEPKSQGRPAGQFGKLARHRGFPLEIVQAEPDITLKELAGARTFDTLLQALGDICDLFDPQECWNFLKAAGYASD